MQIIGCGNPDRRDDGAGLLVIHRLPELGLEALGVSTGTCSGESTALLNAWRDESELVLVDAVVTGAPAGTVHRWVGIPPAVSKPSASTHGLGIIPALRLAQTLGRIPPSLQVYGIEGKQFDVGSRPSPAVEDAAENLAQEIHAAIQTRQRVR